MIQISNCVRIKNRLVKLIKNLRNNLKFITVEIILSFLGN
jgi:hypothetical protein